VVVSRSARCALTCCHVVRFQPWHASLSLGPSGGPYHDLPPKRRWFRYSLRTLFVVVTVIGCWLGYELNWIRERRAFIASEVSTRIDEDWWNCSVTDGGRSAPGLLALFGEEGFSALSVLAESQSVELLTANDRQRLQEARHLFPEATIQTVHLSETKNGKCVKLARPK
jgi:hypothetical protein